MRPVREVLLHPPAPLSSRCALAPARPRRQPPRAAHGDARARRRRDSGCLSSRRAAGPAQGRARLRDPRRRGCGCCPSACRCSRPRSCSGLRAGGCSSPSRDAASRDTAHRSTPTRTTCGTRSPTPSTTRPWRSCTGTRIRPGWVDADGPPRRRRPSRRPGRCLTEIRDGEKRVAAIVHDAALRDEHAFIDGATAYAVITLDNHRLGAEAGALIARGPGLARADPGDRRRRAPEDRARPPRRRAAATRRAAHQAGARGRAHRRRPTGRALSCIRSLGDEVDSTLDEVRSLARGIYPSPLADRGLVEGLRSAAMQAAAAHDRGRDRSPRALPA